MLLLSTWINSILGIKALVISQTMMMPEMTNISCKASWAEGEPWLAATR